MFDGYRDGRFTDKELKSLEGFIPYNPCICCDDASLCESKGYYSCDKKGKYRDYMHTTYPKGTLRCLAELVVTARILKNNVNSEIAANHHEVLIYLKKMINGMHYGAYDYTDLCLEDYSDCKIKEISKRY